MSSIARPHGGGSLKPLLLDGSPLISEQMRAKTLPRIGVSTREAADLLLFGIGAYTPLDGFMGKQDWQSVCDSMTMSSGDNAGKFWPLPITLSTDLATAEHIVIGDEIALYDPERDEILGTMCVTEKYEIDKAYECQALFGTTDKSHPGVDLILRQDDVHLAGPIKVISQSELPGLYGDWYRTPTQTRADFETRGLTKVAALRSSDPRSLKAPELARVAAAAGGHVAIFSQLGGFGYGDGSAGARRQALDEAIEKSGVGDGVICIGHPPTLRPAGARKTQLHALIWRNYGCERMVFVGAPEFSGDGVIGDEVPIAIMDIEPLLTHVKV